MYEISPLEDNHDGHPRLLSYGEKQPHFFSCSVTV